MRLYALILSLTLWCSASHGQQFQIPDIVEDRLDVIDIQLSELSSFDPAYSAPIDVSVGMMPLSEVLRNVAKAAEVNISVRGAEDIRVTCNFRRTKVTDLIYFLCKEYELDIETVGNIVAMYPAAAPPLEPEDIRINYTISANSLSLDLSDNSLAAVTKKITDLTGVNFLFPQTLALERLSGYIVEMPFGAALEAIASMNSLEAVEDAAGVWAFSRGESNSTGQRATIEYRRRTPFSATELSIDSLGLITARIERGEIRDIIADLCEQQNLNYYFITPVTGQTSIWVRQVEFESLLNVMLLGSEYSYYREGDIYIFGNTSKEKPLSSVEVVPMRYRSVNNLSETVPDALKSDVQIAEFADLNSLIVSGDRRQVTRIGTFLRSIDRRVPLVTIEVMIVDATNNRTMETGLDAGFGRQNVTSGGGLTGVDVMLNANSVNGLINSLNGFGSINLGKVGEGFYLGLKFLEESGLLEVRSTPKLSTLNGHEATLKSGETRYYKEIANNFFGSQIPVSTESYTWKSIDANLELKIVPFVSEDGRITLDIEINQTEFTPQEQTEAPPGTVTRSFHSQVHVLNEEMVLLGGIEQNSREQSNGGLPWVSRAPVLKWFFGKNKDNKAERKLNVFIKPSLIV